MNIKDLEYFDCICEEKSFTKAAEKLYISQPSISLAIKRLESELNSKLLERNKYSKELKITNEGELFRKRVKNILLEVNEAKSELINLKSNKIRLGIPPIIGTYFLPKFTNCFSNSELIDRVEFIQSGSVKMQEMIQDGHVDLALIGSLEKNLEGHVSSTVLAKDKFVICISKNNPIAKDKELNFSKLKQSQFIVLGKDNLHLNVLENLFKKHDINDSKISYIDEIQTAKSLIAANLGVGIFVNMAVKDMDGIVTKELKEEIPFYISIAMRKGHFLTDIEKQIINTMTKGNSI